jgi:hypothetical protein
MARLDSLPPDQRAVLQLLLKQGKGYDDIASMLRIDAVAVRGRAMDALDALGPDDVAGLTADQQDEIGDYLLGQQTESERGTMRLFLATSAAGRAWAQAVVAELRPLAGDALPEITFNGAGAGDAESESAVAGEATDSPQARSAGEATNSPQARSAGRERQAPSAGESPDRARTGSARRERQAGRGAQARSSRLGGVLLLAGLGIAIAVVLVLVLGGGGGDKPKPKGASTATTSTTQTKVDAQINLTPPAGAKGGPLGAVQVVSQGSQRGISIALQGLDKSTAYAFWLANSATDFEFLGFTPAVDKDGHVLTASKLPADAGKFKQLILTKETKRAPKRPGTTVLTGTFTLGSGG